MDNRTFKLLTNHVPLKITPGHFATNHSHVNYYLDTTTLKARQNEAKAAAKVLVGAYVSYRITCNNGNQRTLINP